MPKKIETETQILRLISKSPLQVTVDLMKIDAHESKNTSAEHLTKFYKDYHEYLDNYYDGLIITGAPIEHLEFEDVDYWTELEEIMEWSKTHVYSTMHICWGAQAGLYHHYGINKHMLNEKLFGIFSEHLENEYDFLTNGFDEYHNTPHSRHTAIDEDALKACTDLSVLSTSDETGSNIIVTKDYRQIFVTGHFEYAVDTLSNEYYRDLNEGKPIHLPMNYFKDDDPDKGPILSWRSHANLLYRNWINYVYQLTPYVVEDIATCPPIGTSSREEHGYSKAFTKVK